MNKRINQEAEFCGRVPLNQTNLIQPHGVLLVLDKSTDEVLQCSENVETIFKLSAREIAGRPLDTLLDKETVSKLRKRTQRTAEKLPFTFHLGAEEYLATAQAFPEYTIVEIELNPRNDPGSFLSVYEELKYAMMTVEEGTTVLETCQLAAEELKRISAFDKVMIYRFDEDWNGDTIAEVKEEGMDAYIGLKFPASDIPKQARDLYQKTPYRLIPTREYDPVKLFPVLNPRTNAFIDLSYSNLRSVAAVHLEYLKNMNVVASMSTRILVDGKLWGLIACHHRTAKYLSFEMCSVFELLSNVISVKIAAVQQRDVMAFRTEMQTIFTNLLEQIYKHDDLTSGLAQNSAELLKLLNADGLAVVMNKQVFTYGMAPGEKQVADLVMWSQSVGDGKTYHHSSLSAVFEPAMDYAKKSSGVLVLPLGRTSFIIAFREEAIQKVDWGGNPGEAIQFEADGKRYHPRNSFRLWQQTVQHTAIPWTGEEIEVAERFRHFVVESMLNRLYN